MVDPYESTYILTPRINLHTEFSSFIHNGSILSTAVSGQKKTPKKAGQIFEKYNYFCKRTIFCFKEIKKIYSAPNMNEVLNSSLFPVTY